MKRSSRCMLALLLCLCMLMSMAPMAVAAGEGAPAQSHPQTLSEAKGFKSEKFLRDNSYRYADDDVVRAIVLLNDAPAAEVMDVHTITGAVARSESAAAYMDKLADAHTAVYSTMSARRISYNTVFEFDTLLNGFSCDVEYGQLDAIAAIPGVEAVYIANTYSLPEGETPEMSHANVTTGNADVLKNKLASGEGIVIAVLDTGANLKHEAFQPSDTFEYGPLTKEKITELSSQATSPIAGGEYVSEKIPFSYDYADKTSTMSDAGGHGSHVAGIAAGYAATKEGVITFSGAAPGAQLAIMKIFSSYGQGTTSSDIYFAALEDALKLDVDVINMSIGSNSGFTFDSSLETDVFGNIYDKLEKAGIVVCIAAGNSGSMYENAEEGGVISTKGYIGPDYTDYGVVGSPSTYGNNISVASMENSFYKTYVVNVDGQNFEYADSSDPTDPNRWLTKFGGSDQNYLVITDSNGNMSLGKPEDYKTEGSDESAVKGKIAVVQRGEINFEEKLKNAAAAGAIGLIVVNNEPVTLINMQIEKFTIPAVCVRQDAYETFMEKQSGTVKTVKELTEVEIPVAGQMGDYSSWGTTPELTMKPTITSVGGYVNSVDSTTNDDYVIISGTSMACPNMSGSFANVIDYLRGEGLDKSEAAKIARELLESTADLVYDGDGNLYSVRKQGVGLGNAYDAITAYEQGYITDPIQELGDSKKSNTFTFDFELKNNSSAEVTFTPHVAVITDYAENINTKENPVFANTLTSTYLYNDFAGSNTEDNGLVTVDAKDVTVAANSTATATVTITVTEEGVKYLESCGFKNGAFIEGFVQYDATDFTPVHATFLGYWGDWTKAPVFENYDSFDYEEIVSYLLNDEKGQALLEAGATPYDFMDLVTDYNIVLNAYIRGVNIYGMSPGVNYLDYVINDGISTLPYSKERAALSTSDYANLYELYLAPYQLRNAKEITLTITDKSDPAKVYYTTTESYVPKATHNNGVWRYYADYIWDGTDAEDNYLPSGTEVTVSFDVKLPYKDTEQKNVWSFDITIDSTLPEIESAAYDTETGTITVTAKDNEYLAGVYLADENYEILDYATFAGDKGEGFTAKFEDDGTWKNYSSLLVVAMDYATNENAEELALIDSDILGKDVDVSLVTPSGTTHATAKVGETFTFPGCTEKHSGYEFNCWSTAKINSAKTLEEVPETTKLWAPGSELYVTADKALTFYAVYAHGSVQKVDKTQYRQYAGEDYTGAFSLNNSRFVITDKLDEYIELKNIEDIEWIDPYYGFDGAITSYDFNTADKTIRFNLSKVDGTHYTIQNESSKQYLSWKDDYSGLEYLDEAGDNSKWFIEIIEHGPDNNTVRIYAGDKENGKALCTIGDPWDPVKSWGLNDGNAWDFNPVYLSKASDEAFVADFYTTNITEPSIPSVPGPIPPVTTPTKPEEPEEPAKPGPSAVFTDIAQGAWYTDAVDYVMEKGLMTGVSDTSFAPRTPTNRAMMVTILYRLAGSPAVEGTSGFKDVKDGAWYADAITWAKANGIVNGYTADEFRPTGDITREQMVAMLYRYASYAGLDLNAGATTNLQGYSDISSVSSYATAAMQWACGEGIIEGTSDSTLSPKNNALRVQVAVILMRFCENVAL